MCLVLGRQHESFAAEPQKTMSSGEGVILPLQLSAHSVKILGATLR